MKLRKFRGIFTVILVFVFIAWINTSDLGPVDIYYLRHAGHLLAVLGVVFLFMQFLLSSRLKQLEKGFGLDRMLSEHRIYGRIGLILVALHFVFLMFYQWIEFGSLLLNLSLLFGIIALVGLTITAGTAVTYKKLGIAYEVWKNIHIFNYILFPLALVHVFLNARPASLLYYLWIILALGYVALVLYRLHRILYMRSHPYNVVEIIQEADDIWSLYFEGKKFSYRPGQFLMIQLMRNNTLSSSHPFTISSSPTRQNLAVTPKELGDFTSTIKETKVGDLAFIDAPYGVFSFLDYETDELVFIAGGIGITPFMSMLRYMADNQVKKKVTLFWANKNKANLCFQDELGKMQKEMHAFTAVLVMSGEKDWPGEQGRINGKLLQKYLPDPGRQDFFVCGPPPMSRAVRAELEKLGIPLHKIHYEIFEL